MREINYDASIEVYGTTFDNINEVIQYAADGKPKDGVYVGEDSTRYPCFDYEDYIYETRFFWNFVFATSESELNEKLEKLKNALPSAMNYNKITEELSPMVYWGGDTNRELILTDNMG